MDFTWARDWPYAAGAGGYVLITVTGAVGAWRARRGLRRRLTALALRMAEDSLEAPSRLERAGVEPLMTAIERGADHALETAHDASASVVRLAGALDAVPWAVLVCDEDGRPVMRNLAAAQLQSDHEVNALIEGALNGDARPESGVERNLELIGPPRRTIQVRSNIIDDGRRIVGVLVVAEDRTDLLRREQAEKEFVASAGEQLRAPLSAVASLADALGREITGSPGSSSAGSSSSGSSSTGSSTRATQRLAERLRSEAERAEHIVAGLLALGRADSRPTAARETITLEDIVAGAVSTVTEEARRQRVEIAVRGNASDRRDSIVTGDRRQLVTAVGELLDNAVKCSAPGQVVAVTTASHPDLLVTVEDAGPGVPTEDRDRIFERFYRVERRGPDAYAGVGLGLSIAQQVARNHGGSVTVEPARGGGSAFTLRLPRPAAVEESEWPTASAI